MIVTRRILAGIVPWLVLWAAPWCAASAAPPADRVRVAYFLEWPTPNLLAKASGAYGAQLGVPVLWSAFDTGTQMTEAMLAGDIDIAYSQGLAPFIGAVDAGAPFVAVGAAVEYPAEDCVIRRGAGIDPARPDTFAGRTVALPLATMADYSFRMMTRALGVDPRGMRILDRIPSEAAIAVLAGEVDMACGFGGAAMAKMYEAGPLLMDAARKRAANIVSFDVVTVSAAFARDNPGLVEAFLAVTTRANDAWRGSPAQLDAMGLETGLDRSALLRQLERFDFPGAAEQRERLLDPGSVGADAMTTIGAAFATPEAPARVDYSNAVDTRYLP